MFIKWKINIESKETARAEIKIAVKKCKESRKNLEIKHLKRKRLNKLKCDIEAMLDKMKVTKRKIQQVQAKLNQITLTIWLLMITIACNNDKMEIMK